MERHMPLVRDLVRSVLTTPGETDPALRQVIEARSAALGGRPDRGSSHSAAAEVPEELRPYVDKVARHAYEVTDGDVEALKQAGYSEDQIFEITLSAALGASMSRLERALAALRGEEP